MYIKYFNTIIELKIIYTFTKMSYTNLLLNSLIVTSFKLHNTLIRTCDNWEDTARDGIDVTGFFPWVAPLPGFWCCPGFEEANVVEELGPECLLSVKVFIRLVLMLLFWLEGLWPAEVV